MPGYHTTATFAPAETSRIANQHQQILVADHPPCSPCTSVGFGQWQITKGGALPLTLSDITNTMAGDGDTLHPSVISAAATARITKRPTAI